MERYGSQDSIQYRTNDYINLDGKSYQLIVELGVHDYAGRPAFFANIIGTRWTNEGQVYREVHKHQIDRDLDKVAFVENYDLMTLLCHVVNDKKRDEILNRLFLNFVVQPAKIEESTFVENGRFAWFKQFLPVMAKYHFNDIYRNRAREIEQVMEA